MGKSLLMWGACVCHNPLGPTLNLQTTGTVGRQFVLSVRCVKFVSVLLPVSRSDSNFNISSVMSRSVRFVLVAILQIAFWPNSAHTKPNTFWLITFHHLPCLACRMLRLWHGTDSSVELKIDISMNLLFNSQEEIITEEWRMFACHPISH
jgi:hypothetical protein